jgi:hypothetical protein
MKLSNLFVLLSILAALTACGTDPDQRVYGSWTEELTGETIEFRRDGTLTWFGSEGTFAFKKSTNWAACIGLNRCPTGQVAVDVDGQSFRISYWSNRFDENPDSWYLGFRGVSALVQDVTIGDKVSDGFVVYRNAPTVPLAFEGFEKMEDGLEKFHPSFGGQFQVYNDEIVASIDYKLRRFNNSTNSWTTIDGIDDSYGYTLDTQIAYNHEEYSIDGGYTWNAIPSLEEYYREGEPVAIGTTLYRSLRISEDDANGRRETWRLDLSANNPTWEKRSDTSTSTYEPMELIAIAPLGYLLRSQWTENGRLIEMSYDQGANWESIANSCSHTITAHTDGFYCTTMDDGVLWYNVGTDSWTSLELPSASFSVKTPGAVDGIYVLQDNNIVKILGDGTQVVVSEFDVGDKNIGHIFLTEDRLMFNYKTIWTQPRN